MSITETLAKHGANVISANRTASDGEEMVKTMSQRYPKQKFAFIQADMTNMDRYSSRKDCLWKDELELNCAVAVA
jgi:short-subunit dehydrogenase